MPIENVALYNYNITGKIIDESSLVKGASHVTITNTIISGINDVMRGRPCRINEGKLRHVTINRQTLNDVQIITLSQVIRRNEQNEQLPLSKYPSV